MMLRHRLSVKDVSRTSLLAVAIVVLLSSPVNTHALVYQSLVEEAYVTIASPPVILQNGTAGTSTIYTNDTSAKIIVASTGWTWSDELLVNPSFEMGNLTGWTAKGPAAANVEVFNATSGGDAYTNRSLRIGDYGVCTEDQPGTNDDSGVWQNVSLTVYASAIDASDAVMNASAWLYPSEWDWDDCALIVRFYNSSGGFISAWNTTGEYGSGSVYYPQAWMLGQGEAHFTQGQLEKFGCYHYTIPVGTRKVGIQLGMGEHKDTFYCGGQADEASIKIGTHVDNYVDNNTSNVDSSDDKGTHSNFTAQQYGPDSIYDTLTEENASSVGYNWGITSSAFTGTAGHLTYRYMGGTSPNIDNMTVTKLHIRYSGAGTVAIALYTGGILTDPTGATKRTEAYNVTVSAGWNEVDVPDYNWEKGTITWIGWCHSGGSVYYSSSPGDAGDFQSANGRWDQSIPADANESASMPTSPGAGSFSNYWYAVYVEYKAPNYELDLEVQWTNLDYDESNEELAIYIDQPNNTHSLDATGGYMIVGDGTPDWGSTTGTISFWVKMDGSVQGRFWGQNGNMETRWSGTNLILDWGGSGSMTSAYAFSADTWFFVAIVWNETGNDLFLYIGDENNPPTLDSNSLTGTWTSTTPTPTENRFLNGLGGDQPVDGHGDDLRYWDTARTLAEIQSDYNIELTGSETSLKSYFQLNNNFNDIGPDNNDGTGSGSYSSSSDVAFAAPPLENLGIDVWNGSTWQTLFTNLTTGWNNASVVNYLTSSNFTIRFKAENETNDLIQNSWNIDTTVLHTWSSAAIPYDYVLRVNNTAVDSWQIRLRKYSDSNIGRLQNCSIYFHNATGGTSNQVVIENGGYTQDVGSWYDLGNSETVYIAMTAQANSTGISYIYAYLEVLAVGTTTYAQYVITFQIT